MTRYAIQLRGGIFVKSYGLLSFSKNMGKNIGENIRKIAFKKLKQQTQPEVSGSC